MREGPRSCSLSSLRPLSSSDLFELNAITKPEPSTLRLTVGPGRDTRITLIRPKPKLSRGTENELGDGRVLPNDDDNDNAFTITTTQMFKLWEE